jgi:hypothetical protein
MDQPLRLSSEALRSTVQRLVSRTLLALAITGGLGCASVRPNVSLELPGDANPDREDAILRTFRARLSAGARPERQVRVLDSLMTDQPRSEARLLGRVQLEAGALPDMMSVWTFTDYRAGWRKVYCYPQVILTYASVLVWSFLPPSYPCWANGAGGVTKRDLVEDLRLLTDVMGGNLAVATFGSNLDYDSDAISSVTAEVYASDPGNAPRPPESRLPVQPPRVGPSRRLASAPGGPTR